MAYIQPNSTVEFFADLGIDRTYENTLYFASVSAKDSYFSNLTKITTATALSYSRETRGFIRVEKSMSTLIHAGYMRFKNTSFENKWWYAFITSVEYINNVTTQVNFVIDVMMTWMGAFSLKECFIERQHETVDYPGSNIVEEGLDTGEYITERVAPTGFTGIDSTSLTRGWLILVNSTIGANLQPLSGAIYGGIYQGCGAIIFTDPTNVSNFIDDLTDDGKADAIVSITMAPAHYWAFPGTTVIPSWVQYSHAKPYNSINGWTGFKNKKILTYPYKSLLLTNMEGDFSEYRYEFFDGNTYNFKCNGISGVNTELIATPENYKTQIEDITDNMPMRNFPMCSWNVDTFKAWYAQNKSTFWTSMASSVFDTALSAMIPGDVSGVSAIAGAKRSVLDGIGGQLAKATDYARKPPTYGGKCVTDALVTISAKDYYVIEKSITREYAKIIDDYFTLFGYAIKEVRTPNMNARPHWTYIKTVGCTIDGELPADDAASIEEIFDSGIRFWKDHNKIGHYSLYNNAPV